MSVSRRYFSTCSVAGLLAACGPDKAAPTAAPSDATPTKKGPPTMLILGGTGFLGPHVVAAAQERGYTVTLFNRGKTNPHLFPKLEKLRGDRNTDVSALEGRKFDVVVDTSAYFPRQVEATTVVLKDNVGCYLLVSSISVFGDMSKPGLDESAPTAAMPQPYSEKMPDNYGPLKGGCERSTLAAMGDHGLVIRPGLIVGPGDPTDRFTYWPVRMANGGTVLAPNDPKDPVQFIDARDLAAFMVDAAGKGLTGIYNATGPAEPTSIGALLESCREATGSDAELVWAPTPFLAEQKVAPWMQLTVWVPPDDPEFGGMGQVDIGKAVAAGLTFRPVHETVTDTLAWWNDLPEARREKPRAGLASEREREVLTALAASDVQPAA